MSKPSNTKHCCQQLAGSLGDYRFQPIPAYISPADWNSGRQRAGWYPGATRPGYYLIHRAEEPDRAITPHEDCVEPRIEFRPLAACPFCGSWLSLRDFQLPRNWEQAFGYDSEARHVAFYWTPFGDEAMYDDGRTSGDGNWHLFLALRGDLSLDRRYNLGGSDEEAEDWLVMDRETRELAVLPKTEAQVKLSEQWPRLDVDAELATIDWETLSHVLREALDQTEAAMKVIQPCDTCFHSISPGWLRAEDGGFDRCPVCNGHGFLPEPSTLTIGEG